MLKTRSHESDSSAVPLPIRFTHGGGVVGRRLATRPRGTAAGNGLVAAPADRAGFFSEPHTFSGVSFLRRREDAPSCILHPQEARARDLCDGQRVRLFNDRESVGLALKVSDEVQPGNVLVPGQRPDRGTINMLCSDPTPISAREHLAQCSPPGREIDRSSIERSGTSSPVASPHQAEAEERRAE